MEEEDEDKGVSLSTEKRSLGLMESVFNEDEMVESMVSRMFLRELGETVLKAAKICIAEGLGGGVLGRSKEDEGSVILSVEERICKGVSSGTSCSPASRRD